MPANLERCVKHLMADGKSESSAYAICTAQIKKSKKGADVYEDNDKLYLKTFLINSEVSKLGWGVDPMTIDNNIKSFKGTPLVLTEDFDHPYPDNSDTYEHVTDYQERFRIGDIVDITEKNGDYSAIIEITNDKAKKAFKMGELPNYVSPQIYHPNARTEGEIATNWKGVHIALVKNPAWGAVKARVMDQCLGGDKCLAQLRSGSCNNCVDTAIKNYIVSKNEQHRDSSNINIIPNKSSLVDSDNSNETVKTVSVEDFNKLKEQLEQEQARSKVLEDTNKSLNDTNSSNAEKVKALETEFRSDKISEILRDAQYPNDEARNNAIQSFLKSGMSYDEIRGHVAHLKVKSGSFTSKLPTQSEDEKKVKSGSNNDEDENTENFSAAYIINQYGVGVRG